MRHVTLMRDRSLKNVLDMLEHLRIQVSCYLPDEIEVMTVLQRPQQLDLAVALTQMLMQRLGAPETAPKEPRFDVTRRRARKKIPKGPRGVPKAEMPEVPANAT